MPAPLRRVPFNSLPQLVGCTDDNLGKVTAFVELGGCHGNGDFEFVPSGSSGACTCRARATVCTGRGTVNPDCTCACDAAYTGADCSEDPVADATKEETGDYDSFYLTIQILIPIVVCCFCVALAARVSLSVRTIFFVVLFTFRVFDMTTDWAFFSISLREGGEFELEYSAAGHDHTAVWVCSLVFSLLGTCLFCCDTVGLYQRNAGEVGSEEANTVMLVTGAIFLLEDVPQLALQGIYLDFLGFDQADSVAILSFVMSIISVVANLVFGCVQVVTPNAFSF